MGRIVVTEFMTLDGVVEAPGGEPTHPHSGWVAPHFSDEFGAFKLQEILDSGAILLGRTTYESFAGAWPERDDPFAERINGLPKHVVSTTLRDPAWEGTEVIAADVPARVREVRERTDGDVYVAGSATLVKTLLAEGLVDELRLQVFPVVVGGGLRLFADDLAKHDLALTGTRAFPGGVVLLTYGPAAG